MPDAEVDTPKISAEQREYFLFCVNLIVAKLRKRTFGYIETIESDRSRCEAIKMQMRVLTTATWDELRLVSNGEYEIGRKTHDNGHSA